jgi:hypothetical protein
MNKHTKTNVTSDPTASEPQPREVVAEDVVEAKILVTIQGRDLSRRGKDKVRGEQVVGDVYTHATKKWNRKERLIDRDKDWYSEKIIDSETGEILHFCEEPLSKHQGHGSAKRPRRS